MKPHEFISTVDEKDKTIAGIIHGEIRTADHTFLNWTLKYF